MQGPNQEFEGEIEEGNQEAKEAKGAQSTSDIGRSLIGLAYHFIRKLQPKFQEIWGNFGHMENFGSQHGFFLHVRYATGATLRIGSSKSQMAYILGFSMKNHACWCMEKKFGQVLSPHEVKNTKKMTSLPLF